jgi:hypothetical protein
MAGVVPYRPRLLKRGRAGRGHAVGDVVSDIGQGAAGLVGGFAAGSQAQGAISQAQSDQVYAATQQSSQTLMILALLGIGIFIAARHNGQSAASTSSTKGT